MITDCISKYILLNNELCVFEEKKNNLLTNGLVLYEVIRVIDGVPLFVNDHLERLFTSASLLKVHIWFSINEILSSIKSFIELESFDNGNIRIHFSFKDEKREFLIYRSQHSYPLQEQYKQGVITKSIQLERDNPNAKNIQVFHSIVKEFFLKNDIYEAILIDKNGCVTEGSKSNIFFIKERTLITARIKDVLPGITRKYVLEAARNLQLNIEERAISYTEIAYFDAAFISGTSPKILPIKLIDNSMFETNNNVLLQLMAELDCLIAENIKKNKELQ